MAVPFPPILDIRNLGDIGNYLPLEGLWETTGVGKILVILIAIRLILFAINAHPIRDDKGLRLGDPLVYLVALVFLPTWLVGVIAAIHLMKIWLLQNNMLPNMPEEEGEVSDLGLIYVSAILALLASMFQNIANFWQGVPLNAFTITIGLLLLLVLSSKGLKQDDGRARMKTKGLSLLVLLIFLGSNAFFFFVIYLMIAPYIKKFNPISKASQKLIADPARNYHRKIKDKVNPVLADAVNNLANGMEKTHETLFQRIEEGEEAARRSSRDASKAIRAELKAKNAELAAIERRYANNNNFDNSVLDKIDQLQREIKDLEVRGAQQVQNARQVQEETKKSSKLDKLEMAGMMTGQPEISAAAAVAKKVVGRFGRTRAKHIENVPRFALLWFLLCLGNDYLDALGFASPFAVGIGLDIILALFLFGSFAKIGVTRLLLIVAIILELFFVPLMPYFVCYFVLAWFIDRIANPMSRQKAELNQGPFSWFTNYGPHILLLIFVIGFILPLSGVQLNTAGFIFDVQKTMLKAQDEAAGLQLDLEEVSLGERISNYWNRNFIDPIANNYDVTEVEQNRNKQNGFKLTRRDNLGSGRVMSPFYASFDIEGGSLNLDTCNVDSSQDVCFVNYRCEAEGGTASAEIPLVNIRDIEQGGAVLTCTYTPTSRGTNDVTAVATQLVKSKAFVETYFIWESTYTQAEQSKGDQPTDVALARLIQIPELKPVSKSIGGPFVIGIGVAGGFRQESGSVLRMEERSGQYYINLNEDSGGNIRHLGEDFGFTIRKDWDEGKLIRIHSIKIKAPDIVKIERCTSSKAPNLQFELTEHNEESGQIIYELKSPLTVNIDDALVVDCRIYANEIKDPEIRGPVRIDHIIVEADYEYEQRKSMKVNVESSAGEIIAVDDFTRGLDVCPDDANSCADYSQESCGRDPCGYACLFEKNEGIIYDTYSCNSCDNVESCEDYETESNCRLDPCAKQCEWNKDINLCRPFNTELTLGSITENNDMRVDSCSDDNTEFEISTFGVLAIDSGRVTNNEDSITLTLPGGYTVEYSGFFQLNRFEGNVVRGEILGYAEDRIRIRILKDGLPLSFGEVKQIYENRQRIREVSPVVFRAGLQSGCSDEVEDEIEIST